MNRLYSKGISDIYNPELKIIITPSKIIIIG